MFIRRFLQLQFGLCLYGVSLALMVRADLGLDPWDVFHQGLSERTGLSLGTVLIIVGAAVMLFWIPLRQKPGIGTLCNIVVIGLVTDAALKVMPHLDHLGVRVLALGATIMLNAVATAAYIGAGMGPGPRDGLMTGLVRRTGWPLRWTRTGIEATVLGLGWLLGGSVGIGTVLYAVAIGPLIQIFLPYFQVEPKREPALATTT
ncbi:YitT family protein [Brevundimonas faecalis]|uniref:membrane protein YczE n=1 Tax=Brevundimonas faecalis TaxID=947378 RepID=UPI00361E4D36